MKKLLAPLSAVILITLMPSPAKSLSYYDRRASFEKTFVTSTVWGTAVDITLPSPQLPSDLTGSTATCLTNVSLIGSGQLYYQEMGVIELPVDATRAVPERRFYVSWIDPLGGEHFEKFGDASAYMGSTVRFMIARSSTSPDNSNATWNFYIKTPTTPPQILATDQNLTGWTLVRKADSKGQNIMRSYCQLYCYPGTPIGETTFRNFQAIAPVDVGDVTMNIDGTVTHVLTNTWCSVTGFKATKTPIDAYYVTILDSVDSLGKGRAYFSKTL